MRLAAASRRNPWKRPKKISYRRQCRRCRKLFMTKAKTGKICLNCNRGSNPVSERPCETQ